MDRRVWACGLVAILAACSRKEADKDPPTHVTVGAFAVDVAGAGFRVTPQSDPARVLLESSPAEAFKVRQTTATYEMMYGAWRITDGFDSWSVAAGLHVAEQGGDRVRLVWEDGAGAEVGSLELSSGVPGILTLVVTAARADANRVALSFQCAATDHFLGFGAQADGIDHRGHKVPIWTSEPGIGKSDSDDPPDVWFLQGARHASSMGLPTWLSNRGYVGVVEDSHRSIFDLCKADPAAWSVEVWTRQFQMRIVDGPTPAEAVQRFVPNVTGTPPRPPAAVFAPWNDAIFGSQNVRDVAALLRARKIPSSTLWTEDFRGGVLQDDGSYRLKEEWRLDRSLYPDAEAVAAELTQSGFAWLAYFNAFLVQGSQAYTEAVAGGHMVQDPRGGNYLFDGPTFQPTGWADLSREQTREWVKGFMREAMDVGFTGWMADFGEWLPHNAVLSSGEDPLACHDLYPDWWVRLNAAVQAERAGDGTPRWFFARSGWLTSPSTIPVFWPGDQRTSFQRDDGMYTVIPMGLNVGLAGVSTYGHDIAGYQDATNPTSTKELFFRWTTLGALSPVMRTHHGVKAKLNWWFGQDEETLAHYKRWATLHIQLFPYLDAGSAVAERTGMPLMRMLPLAFPADEAGWTLSDEYLLGPDLLVAPVVEEGATSRSVHIPAGTWLPMDQGAPVTGPADISVDVPVTELARYVRAGAVIPMLPETVQTLLPAAPPTVDLEDVQDQRVLRVYLGADGRFTERDGTAYALQGSTAGEPQTLMEGSTALAACADASARGCVAARDGTARRLTVRLAGQGPLTLGSGTLSVQGTARQLDVEVRW